MITKQKNIACNLLLIFAFLCATTFNLQFDMTSNKLNSINDNMQKTLLSLPHKINIDIFSNNSVSKEYIYSIVAPLQTLTKTIYIKEKSMAKNERPRLEISYTDTTEALYIEEEINLSKILAVIFKLINNHQSQILFITGHQEDDNVDLFLQSMREHGNNLAFFNLYELQQIPQDVKLLILNAPQGEFLESEEALLNTYLANGGKLLYIATQKSYIPKLLNFFNIDTTNQPIVANNILFSSGNFIQTTITDIKVLLEKASKPLAIQHKNIIVISEDLINDKNFNKLETANFMLGLINDFLDYNYVFNTQIPIAKDLELNIKFEYLAIIKTILLLLPIILISLHPTSRLKMWVYINKAIHKYVKRRASEEKTV